MATFDSNFWKQARMNSGLSQVKVANTLGYSSPQLVSNWERGICSPPRKDIPKIAKMYKVDPEKYISLVIKHEREMLSQLFNSSKRRKCC